MRPNCWLHHEPVIVSSMSTITTRWLHALMSWTGWPALLFALSDKRFSGNLLCNNTWGGNRCHCCYLYGWLSGINTLTDSSTCWHDQTLWRNGKSFRSTRVWERWWWVCLLGYWWWQNTTASNALTLSWAPPVEKHRERDEWDIWRASDHHQTSCRNSHTRALLTEHTQTHRRTDFTCLHVFRNTLTALMNTSVW